MTKHPDTLIQTQLTKGEFGFLRPEAQFEPVLLEESELRLSSNLAATSKTTTLSCPCWGGGSGILGKFSPAAIFAQYPSGGRGMPIFLHVFASATSETPTVAASF